MRILTVDDNYANLEFLEGALWIYGCPIDRAKNGFEALSKVIFTTSDLDAMSERFMKQTGCRYLEKPLRLVEIRKAVNVVLTKHPFDMIFDY
jgi:CheY-like chemotaxis protein